MDHIKIYKYFPDNTNINPLFNENIYKHVILLYISSMAGGKKQEKTNFKGRDIISIYDLNKKEIINGQDDEVVETD